MKSKFILLSLFAASLSFGDILTMYTPSAGDAQFYWNTKYGLDAYTTGETTMGIYLYFGAPYGNDHTVSIFEVPISPLAGEILVSASLRVDSTGFGTNYYYGSASIGWLDVAGATGDVVADGMGVPAKGVPGQMAIWNSDWGTNSAGTQSFNVMTYVTADLAAGRSHSTFVMSGSRETYGSIYTAENGGGTGPRIVAEVVPEPGTAGLVLLSCLPLALVLRKRFRSRPSRRSV